MLLVDLYINWSHAVVWLWFEVNIHEDHKEKFEFGRSRTELHVKPGLKATQAGSLKTHPTFTEYLHEIIRCISGFHFD